MGIIVSCFSPVGYVTPPGPKAETEPPKGTGEALYMAARDGKVDLVRGLCSEWAGNVKALNWKDSTGRTPLYAACTYDHHEVVSALICTSGVDINMPTHSGRSPLWIAAHYGYTQSVRVLLSAKDRGLDIKLKATGGDDKGKTALMVAKEEALKGDMDCSEVVKLLEKSGVKDL